MKTALNLLTVGLFLATLGTGFGQPVIITQPQSQTNIVGTTAIFWVEATNVRVPGLPVAEVRRSELVGPRDPHQRHVGPHQCADQ